MIKEIKNKKIRLELKEGKIKLPKEIQEKIAEEEKDKIGEELYQAFASGGKAGYSEAAAKYKDKFDSEYLSYDGQNHLRI